MNTTNSTQKIYCYVDETGQDTKGQIFIVSVVVAQEDRDQLTALLESLEQATGKNATKWSKTSKSVKQKFIEQLFQHQILQRKIFYSIFGGSTTYQELTVLTIAAAIHATRRKTKYKASIFIDGLQRSEVMIVGSRLRKIGVTTEKVRGVRDESHVLIRLADAIAGFIREYKEESAYTKALYDLAVRNKILDEV